MISTASFLGGQYKYSVKCMRFHQCVLSTTLGIGETLLNAPSAMLRPSEEQNFDLAKLIFIRVRYVHADPINFIF